ncbi:hypothetical protein CATYP_01530 [Corynebacterium atypicum]|uniref:DUF445 domain-containing protein n=1 Tax=Corynebacterium atypicum TaxID=191610 RepID=A0ABM5QLC4_9CORY|nr:DUF445 family protein [Corynebacterium atypicum]AIG63577.1 hypothetical protein CATYP_01530 [Corynebacterium atypicum]
MGRHNLPSAAPEVEAARRATLRRHKLFVTGLLVLAAVIFVACQWYEHSPGPTAAWVGYVSAAAEAGMVGGLADWFAVTALFRHPMGIPIPHTALIPKKKDQLGEALSSFVGENFLNAELITEKIAGANLAARAGQWLAQSKNADRVSSEAGRLIASAVRAVNAEEAREVIDRSVVQRLAEGSWGPPLGRTLDELLKEGKVDPLIDEAARWADRAVRGSEQAIIDAVNARKPIWAPRFVNNLVGEKIYRELAKFTGDVAEDPHHPARHALRGKLSGFAADLQHDPRLIERVDLWKRDVMDSQAVRDAAASLWERGSHLIIDAAEGEASALRTRVAQLAQRWGRRLVEDEKVRDSANRKVVGVAAFLAEHYSTEITSIISETVRAWDAAEASEKIELMVGKDLQFIRLNGTIVGALAGLAIYTGAQLLFG